MDEGESDDDKPKGSCFMEETTAAHAEGDG
jgi:hypothetical protein